MSRTIGNIDDANNATTNNNHNGTSIEKMHDDITTTATTTASDEDEENNNNNNNSGSNSNSNSMVGLGYDEEDRSELSRIHALVRLIVGPIKHYNLLSIQGRRRYCDLITEEPLGPSLRWIPLIVLMVLVQIHDTTVALWTTFVLIFVQCSIEKYHSTYKPLLYPPYYWLSVSQAVGTILLA